MSELKKLSYEKYRIVLTHEYIDSDGQKHRLEEPLAVEYTLLLDNMGFTVRPSVLINEMMDKLKIGLLTRFENNE